MKKNNEQKIKEAQEVLLKRQERVGRCQQKIQKALEEEGCILEAQAVLTSKGVDFQIMVMVKDD